MKTKKIIATLSMLVAFNSFADQQTFDDLLAQSYELKVASLDGGSSPTIHIYLQSPDKAKVYLCEADDSFPHQMKLCEEVSSQ